MRYTLLISLVAMLFGGCAHAWTPDELAFYRDCLTSYQDVTQGSAYNTRLAQQYCTRELQALRGPSFADRLAAGLRGFGAGMQGNRSTPASSPSVGGYSYPSSSTPPGFERDLNGNLRAQTPDGSNQFFDRQQQLQEQRQLEQQEQFRQQWQDIQRRTERQRQGGRWCQGDC